MEDSNFQYIPLVGMPAAYREFGSNIVSLFGDASGHFDEFFDSGLGSIRSGLILVGDVACAVGLIKYLS